MAQAHDVKEAYFSHFVHIICMEESSKYSILDTLHVYIYIYIYIYIHIYI